MSKTKGLNAEIIFEALVAAKGNKRRAAMELGITRNTLLYWVDKAGIKVIINRTVEWES